MRDKAGAFPIIRKIVKQNDEELTKAMENAIELITNEIKKNGGRGVKPEIYNEIIAAVEKMAE